MPGCAFLVLVDQTEGDDLGESGVGGGELHLLALGVFADKQEGVVGLGVVEGVHSEGVHSEGQQVGDAAGSPHITLVGVGFVLELFGRGVEEGALVEGEVVHP